MSFARLTVGGRGLHLENRLASESVRVSTTKCVMFSIPDTHPPPPKKRGKEASHKRAKRNLSQRPTILSNRPVASEPSMTGRDGRKRVRGEEWSVGRERHQARRQREAGASR